MEFTHVAMYKGFIMRFLVTGASGNLGSYILRELRRSDLDVVAWSGSRTGKLFNPRLWPVNLANRDAVVDAFRKSRPAIVLHAAALSTVAACYGDPKSAKLINVDATKLLTELAAEANVRLLYVSTDLAFDGERGCYGEKDEPSPTSIYGQTKVRAERTVIQHAGHAIVRISLLFGPTLIGQPSFFDKQLDALRGHGMVNLFSDEWRTPLSLLTVARGLVQIAQSDYCGLLHMGGPERMSRWEAGQRLAGALDLDGKSLVPTQRSSTPSMEPRPRDVSLNSSRWRKYFPDSDWPTFEDALRQLKNDL